MLVLKPYCHGPAAVVVQQAACNVAVSLPLDIDLVEGVLQCRVDVSDPRVTGIEEWTLVDPYRIRYSASSRTGTVRGLRRAGTRNR